MEINYSKLNYQNQQTRKRFRKRVTETEDSMLCQECGGRGSWVEPILDYGEGPFEECGFCLGTGRTTKWLRGLWLRLKKKQRNFK